MRLIAALLMASLLFPGCAKNPVPFAKDHLTRGFENQRAFLIGKWLGEAPLEDGGKRVWLNQRFEDGTYVVTFQAYQNGQYVDELSEFGDWGLSGDVYFTMMRGYGTKMIRAGVGEARGSYDDDAYRITKLTPDEFHYTSVATGNSYIVKKVPANFSLKRQPNQTLEPMSQKRHD